MLMELSVMEQRYQAVLAVVRDGWTVTDVAEKWGVSRQSVHAWLARYRDGGLEALTVASTEGLSASGRDRGRGAAV